MQITKEFLEAEIAELQKEAGKAEVFLLQSKQQFRPIKCLSIA